MSIKIKNQSSPVLLAYQQMLEHTNVTLDEMATKMVEHEKEGAISKNFLDKKMEFIKDKFQKNNEIISEISKEVNSRIKNIFPKASTEDLLFKLSASWEKETTRVTEEKKKNKKEGAAVMKKVMDLGTSNEKEV